jgi:hypothetical protein
METQSGYRGRWQSVRPVGVAIDSQDNVASPCWAPWPVEVRPEGVATGSQGSQIAQSRHYSSGCG